MNPLYDAGARRARHRCEYCRAPEIVFNFPFEVEHVTPASHGGSDDEDNLALACRACDLWKSDHVVAADPESGAETRLFHPRADSWETHFSFRQDTAQIVGLTALGRATVSRLQVNSDAQLAARKQWMRLGLLDTVGA